MSWQSVIDIYFKKHLFYQSPERRMRRENSVKLKEKCEILRQKKTVLDFVSSNIFGEFRSMVGHDSQSAFTP